jgi:hypothetical protein
MRARMPCDGQLALKGFALGIDDLGRRAGTRRCVLIL